MKSKSRSCCTNKTGSLCGICEALIILDSLSGSVDENRISEDDRQPLEEDSRRAGVVQILHHQHVSVKVLSHVGQAELEPGEQRRVVQGPL